MPIHKEPVFACAPSAYGFKSLFPQIFCPEDYERVYILKGSCGSGKSSLIRRFADECERRGTEYELFACSFDPDSCDGIIISEPNVCIIDGTSPHVMEPMYPGAVETVVNTSDGLDSQSLPARRDEIIELCRRSSTFFGKSYSFLRASLEIQNNLTDIITENFQFGKMFSSIKRFLARNFTYGSGFERKERLTEVLCKDGIYKSNAFFERADKKCLVLDKFGAAHLLLSELAQAAARYNQPVFVSLSPLDFEKINGLYFPGLGMAFQVSDNCPDRGGYFHVFNMARFVDKNAVRQSKYKIRFLKKCRDELTEGAVASLGEAYTAHMKLESIYSGSTDYSQNEELYRRLHKSVFDSGLK